MTCWCRLLLDTVIMIGESYQVIDEYREEASGEAQNSQMVALDDPKSDNTVQQSYGTNQQRDIYKQC